MFAAISRSVARETGQRRMVLAHRFAYELFVGPIPKGRHIDHLCRNPLCVNPDHMEPVTLRENTQRGNAGKALRERTHCVNGHEFTPENTYMRRDKPNARRCRICYRQADARRRERNRNK